MLFDQASNVAREIPARTSLVAIIHKQSLNAHISSQWTSFRYRFWLAQLLYTETHPQRTTKTTAQADPLLPSKRADTT